MSLFSKVMMSVCCLMAGVATLVAQPSFRMHEVVGPEAGATVRAYALSDRGHVLGLYGDINRQVYVYQPYTGMSVIEGDLLYPSDINSSGYAVGGAYPNWLVVNGQVMDLSTSGSSDIFINDHLQTAGQRFVGSSRIGFFQKSVKEGEPMTISVDGYDATEPTDLNNEGHVVGLFKKNDGKYYAFAWDAINGGTELDITPGPFDRAEAFAVNDKGDIVAGNKVQMWYLHAEGERELVDAPGGGFAKVVGMNNAGQVIGSYGYSGPATPFYWANGESYDLVDLIDNFPADLRLSTVVDINNRGQILIHTFDNSNRLQAWVLLPRRFNAEISR